MHAQRPAAQVASVGNCYWICALSPNYSITRIMEKKGRSGYRHIFAEVLVLAPNDGPFATVGVVNCIVLRLICT